MFQRHNLNGAMIGLGCLTLTASSESSVTTRKQNSGLERPAIDAGNKTRNGSKAAADPRDIGVCRSQV
jgi:hypothetical protein